MPDQPGLASGPGSASEATVRLNHIERDGLASILSVILSVPDLGCRGPALADRQKALAGSDNR
ncbi:hypothetical protein JIX56_47440 [Streptomyces sp. CA-210063]|uniref:hypothetical protein n=1 Tax=Streptomyces sp. CA-210063 TaxID=2801029 RepID=UPI00214B06D3|nr:hypothetical protein [Streptomyces sp. CA-210063]UUU36822.1 hypothetical protein JIX56_47440 [Streptomyces sp. CA-210063]